MGLDTSMAAVRMPILVAEIACVALENVRGIVIALAVCEP